MDGYASGPVAHWFHATTTRTRDRSFRLLLETVRDLAGTEPGSSELAVQTPDDACNSRLVVIANSN
jgi:hypothetical protein